MTNSDKILRRPAVQSLTGLSRTGIWRYVQAGSFPAPIQLGPRAIGWRASEVQAWIESRPRARGTA